MKAIRFTVLAFGLIGLTIGLTGCQTMSQTWENVKNIDLGLDQTNAQTNIQRQEAALPTVSCPQVKIVDELSALSEFSDLSSPADFNLISRVTLAQSESKCTYDGNNAVVDLKLVFDGQIGPKGRVKPGDTPTFSYPFFIAVTNSKNEIKAKEVFGASVTYAAGENSHTYYESLRQIIPVESGMEAQNFNVLVGFQLTPDQLRYNRANVIPAASEARRLEENMKEQVQMGSNNAGTALGLTSAAQQNGSGIKITPGYPAAAVPAVATTSASAAAAAAAAKSAVAAAAPVKKAPAQPRKIKNPPVQLVTARKPAKSAPAEPAAAAAPAAPAAVATPAPAAPAAQEPAAASPVAIPGGQAVVVPGSAPAAAPVPTPTPTAAPQAVIPPAATPQATPTQAPAAPTTTAPAQPAAPAAPEDPNKKDPNKGAMNDKGIEMEQLMPAAGQETAPQSDVAKREPISSIDLTAPIE